jgi:lipid II:glycine glycyltransferase (peptidoglycan interpeptide bridge formation enzyme)
MTGNNTVEIKPVQTKKEWETFLLSCDLPPFLQSWNSAEQSEALGNQTLRIGIYKNDELIGICLTELINAKRGSYIYAPYGPVLRDLEKTYFDQLIDYLQEWGRENQFDFIRLSPYWENNEANRNLLSDAGFQVAPIHMLSELVWKLDLTPSEDELLMNMRKTTRNLIRRAKKDGVEVHKSQDEADIRKFIELMRVTHKRHSFVPYPDKLYYQQVSSFKEDDQVIVFTGEYEKKTIAASIVMYYGNTASYHHGASIRSKVPVAYLLQWEAIKEAKKRGCREYSFWGIVETENKKHPFYGISKFKKGFGGSPRYLVPAHDLPISWKYYVLTYPVETFRRVKRGFGWKREQ